MSTANPELLKTALATHEIHAAPKGSAIALAREIMCFPLSPILDEDLFRVCVTSAARVIEQASPAAATPLSVGSLTVNGVEFVPKAAPMHLNQEELHAALGRAMEHIERGGANPDLTNAVIIVGDVRQSIGNQWNKADPYAAQRVRDALKK